MNKITQYLNEHILGEVTSDKPIRQKFSRDGSLLTIMPEIIVHPRITNDIRKVARFSWQLAEKGHILPITARGGGSDQTGAAIGSGIVINTMAHLNQILAINLKGKDLYIHVQPGVRFSTLNEVLKVNGLIIPSYPTSSNYSTIGGAIANNAGGTLSGSYGLTEKYVSSLEVVLANGDLIETKRINRRELDKIKGLQTFEGELYRKIDGLIEDNQQLIDEKIPNNLRDNTGYCSIKKVKNHDGSFDLTPLIIGSQGTLGIVSEAVLKPIFYNETDSVIIATFNSSEIARDAADQLAVLKPATLNIIDGQILQRVKDTTGKKFMFSDILADDISAILTISFDDLNTKSQQKNIKKSLKKLSKFDTTLFTSKDQPIDEINAIREITSLSLQSDTDLDSMPPLIDGAAISANRREEFIIEVSELAKKHHIELPICIDWLSGVIHARPIMQLHQISERQKVFKLINDYYDLVIKFDGSILAESGEGRLKSAAIYSQLDADVIDLYDQIRKIFDPFEMLNPEVKQKNDLKKLVSYLNVNYDLADFAKYSPRF